MVEMIEMIKVKLENEVRQSSIEKTQGARGESPETVVELASGTALSFTRSACAGVGE